MRSQTTVIPVHRAGHRRSDRISLNNRTSNGGRRMEFHAGAQTIESPSEARRSAPHRSSEDRSDRGLAGGALRNHAWPIDSREAKESRTVVTCRLATTLCPAFPVVGIRG